VPVGPCYKTGMIIDVFSDPVCPWCFIGKRRLERALAARPQPGLTVNWRTFQLNPDMPKDGMDRRVYLEIKFGTPRNAATIYDRISAAGAEEGIEFAFSTIKRTPNTIQSHRLIRLAGVEGQQDAVVEALFRAYFLRGEDIGDPQILTAAGAEGGLDADLVTAFLRGDAGRAIIRRHGYSLPEVKE